MVESYGCAASSCTTYTPEPSTWTGCTLCRLLKQGYGIGLMREARASMPLWPELVRVEQPKRQQAAAVVEPVRVEQSKGQQAAYMPLTE